ncbi:unnamed protein product [Echinostoma caproni]|uniref:Uncharacterized protein n=1 Tax=Echinostoma caproni TaxID=27848 RepID=A0A3P8F5Q9_9TREM|nr:unnamed protein product [Echinostoma caproni]
MQKEQRKNVLKKPLAPTRRDRLRTRVLAARPRLQRRLRLQNTTGSPGRRQTRTLRGRQPRPNTSATTVSSSAALAVLKRARRTAVEAAKAAAQAAALINQSQSRRRDVFDANRNLPSRTSAKANSKETEAIAKRRGVGQYPEQTNRGYYVNRAQNRNIAADQAREREYLAQARALIRAQSEQTQQFYGAAQNNNFGQHIGPARGRRGRRGYQSRY